MNDSEPRRRPLEGVRVVGLEQSVAGPLCSRILADLGADVVKVERAGSGDFARHWDDHVAGESAQFWWLNRAKRSVALDLADPDDRRVLDDLIGSAHVLVHNMSPAAAGRLGIDGESMRARHPGVVSCQMSGYGADTPLTDRKAYDMLVQAESGIMSLTGTDDTPTRAGVSLCDVTTGLYGAILVLGALREQERSGRGAQIDLAMFDVGIELVGPMLTSYLNGDVVYDRVPQHHHAIAPYGVFSGSDGKVVLAIEQDAEWMRFCDHVLGRPDLGARSDYARNLDRIARREEVNAHVDAVLSGLPVAEIERRLEAGGFAFSTLNDMADLEDHPVIDARGIVAPARTRDGRPARALIGAGERVFAGRPPGRTRPPALDEDGPEVRRSLSSDEDGEGCWSW